jgi:hypothetical protein
VLFPDHLEVSVGGAPPLNVRYSEVGLKESEIARVGGPTRSFWYQALPAYLLRARQNGPVVIECQVARCKSSELTGTVLDENSVHPVTPVRVHA